MQRADKNNYNQLHVGGKILHFILSEAFSSNVTNLSLYAEYKFKLIVVIVERIRRNMAIKFDIYLSDWDFFSLEDKWNSDRMLMDVALTTRNPN